MMTDDDSDVSARVLDGEGLRIGDWFWPRPDPPLLAERARLVRQHIPPGTLAAGVSAGWVWTGMGLPTPVSLIALRQPAPSPLARHEWKIRGVSPGPDDTTTVAGLCLLTQAATVRDLWQVSAQDDVAAAQLFWLGAAVPTDARATQAARRRAETLAAWLRDYPWANR